MGSDYYGDAMEIAEALASEGRAPEAEAIRTTVSQGSTATEILMGVRWHLRNLIEDRAILRRETADRVSRLLTQLDAELSA